MLLLYHKRLTTYVTFVILPFDNLCSCCGITFYNLYSCCDHTFWQ